MHSRIAGCRSARGSVRRRGANASRLLGSLIFCLWIATANGGETWTGHTYPPRTGVETPHIPWAKPYPGRRLRALVIGDYRTQRESVELMERLDVECVPFMCPGGAYEVELGGAAGVEKLRQRLAEPFDVVIAPGSLVGQFTPALVEALAGRLREGVGFVYLWPADKPQSLLIELGVLPRPPAAPAGSVEELTKETHEEREDDALMLDLGERRRAWERDALEYLAEGVPLSYLAGLQPARQAEGETPRPPIGLQHCGKGRVVLIGRVGSCQPGSPSLPVPEGESDLLYEYYMSLLIKAVLWATGRESEVRIVPAGNEGEAKLTFALKNKGKALRATLTLAVRSDRDLQVLPAAPWAEPGVHQSASVLEAIHSEVRSAELPEGECSFAFSLPLLPAGRYFADLRVTADGQNINWATVPWEVAGGVSIAGIEFKPDAVNLAEGSRVRARVDLAQPARPGWSLDVALVDNYARLLISQTIPLQDGTRSVAMTMEVPDARTTLFKLRAALSADGRVQDVRTGYFTVYNRPWPTFTFFAWGCGSAGSYLGRHLHRVAAYHGVDASNGAIDLATLRVADIRAVGSVAWNLGKTDPGEMVASPCCTDPAYRAELRRGIAARAETRRVSDCFGYTTGDETSYADAGLFAGCSSESGTAHLQDFLKRQYGTVAALNKQWDTEYGSFEEVRAITDPAAYNERAARTGNFSARIDQWLANYDGYMDWFRYLRDTLKLYAPGARFGIQTTCFYGHERGYDFPRMMRYCDFASPYRGWPPYFDCVQNFALPDLVFGAHTVTRELDVFGRESWDAPFWTLLRGGRNVWYYLFTIGGEGAVTPYLDLYPCLDAYCDAVQTVKSGLAELLLGAKRETDPVAVYYSSPSLVFSSAISGPKHILGIRDFNRALFDLGFQGQILDRDQVLDGALEKRGIRLLCLPMVQCVGSRESEVLRGFVEGGGLLIADYRPGIADEHGRLFAQTGCTSLFGLRWDEQLLAKGTPNFLTPLAATKATYSATLGEHKLDGLVIDGAIDKTLRLAGAQALALADGVPLLTYRKVGKGAAACLNMPVNRAAVRLLLAAHGIASPADIQDSAPGGDTARECSFVEVSRFADGAARYYGLTTSLRDVKPQQVAIPLGRRGHIYDLLNRKHLGEADRIEVRDFGSPVRIFSVLPYVLRGLTVRVPEGPIRPGGEIRGTIALDTGGARPARHVLHIAVQRPDGRTVRYLSRNVETQEGEARFALPLALNEPHGRWNLSVRDVATGVEAALAVVCEPAPRVEGIAPQAFEASQSQTIPDWKEKPPPLARCLAGFDIADSNRRIEIVERISKEKASDEAALAVLKEAVQDADPVLCWTALQALGDLGSTAKPAAASIAEVLRRTTTLRSVALRTLRRMGEESARTALPQVAECLDSADPRIRFEALLTIAAARRCEDPDVRSRIVKCYMKHDHETASLDCNVLAAYISAVSILPAHEEAIPLYCRALEGFPMPIRLTKEEAHVVQINELTRTRGRFTYYEGVLKRLHQNNYAYRLMAIRSLRELGAKAKSAIPCAVRALEDLLEKREKLSSSTRIDIWLGRLPNTEPPADDDFQVACSICQFLGSFGPEAKSALRALKGVRALNPTLAATAQAAMDKIDPLFDAAKELEDDDPAHDTRAREGGSSSDAHGD